MTELATKRLSGEAQEMDDLQRVLAEAPEYALRTGGETAPPDAAHSLFSALPPAKTYADKFVLGFYAEGQMVGCADLIRGYPRPETAMLGLLLFSERHQRKGYGLAAYLEVEKFCLSWPEVDTARIGVVETNISVLPFWEKMGFVDTGTRRPFEHGSVKSETIVLEKKIRRPL